MIRIEKFALETELVFISIILAFFLSLQVVFQKQLPSLCFSDSIIRTPSR